jgi:hypothetical protein
MREGEGDGKTNDNDRATPACMMKVVPWQKSTTSHKPVLHHCCPCWQR